ncbi:MAG: hypothetical protein L6W00_11960 [Lentisphaeria bacterium]|nr:MAG: hypothetical protein L6W00_11960 [Lentisphaeria bacterium]
MKPAMKTILAEYEQTFSGAWLRKTPWRNIELRSMSGTEGKVQAMYSALFDRLYVAPDKSEAVWFGSVVHELRHAYQRHRFGLLLYMLLKIIRPVVERPAKQAELEATEWLCRKNEEEHEKTLERRRCQ